MDTTWTYAPAPRTYDISNPSVLAMIVGAAVTIVTTVLKFLSAKKEADAREAREAEERRRSENKPIKMEYNASRNMYEFDRNPQMDRMNAQGYGMGVVMNTNPYDRTFSGYNNGYNQPQFFQNTSPYAYPQQQISDMSPMQNSNHQMIQQQVNNMTHQACQPIQPQLPQQPLVPQPVQQQSYEQPSIQPQQQPNPQPQQQCQYDPEIFNALYGKSLGYCSMSSEPDPLFDNFREQMEQKKQQFQQQMTSPYLDRPQGYNPTYGMIPGQPLPMMNPYEQYHGYDAYPPGQKPIVTISLAKNHDYYNPTYGMLPGEPNKTYPNGYGYAYWYGYPYAA